MNKLLKYTSKPSCVAILVLALSACGGGVSGTGDPTIIDPDNSNTGANGSTDPGTDTGGDTGTDTGGNGGTDTGGDGGTDTGNTDSNTTNGLVAGSNNGLLDTATPTFTWTSVEGADAYRLILTEPAGNYIVYNASTAACAGTECSLTPTAAFYDSIINWRVEALSNGQVLQSTESGSYTTPLSLELTPVTSNPSVCSIWPSVAYDNFIVLNNIWNAGAVSSNAWSQTIGVAQSEDGRTVPAWQYDWLSETDGDRSAVKAYPEVIYGNKLGVHVSGTKEETGLPETAGNLPEFTIDFAYSETLDGDVERNVALESFFHDSCNITGPCDLTDNRAFEMMVWVNNPESNRPGDLAATGVMIDNRLWNVYIKPRSDKKYIAFTAQTPFTSGTLQWNRFVEWTMQWTAENAESLQINTLTPDLCMAAIELGTEHWWGAGSFSLDRYTISKGN